MRFGIPELTVESVGRVSVKLAYTDEDGYIRTIYLSPQHLWRTGKRKRRPRLGDTVRLASGGQLMTVASMGSPAAQNCGEVKCEYLSKGVKKTQWLPKVILEVVKDA